MTNLPRFFHSTLSFDFNLSKAAAARNGSKKRRTKQDTKSNHRRAKMILIHYSIEHKP
jgi:hypothetical protein